MKHYTQTSCVFDTLQNPAFSPALSASQETVMLTVYARYYFFTGQIQLKLEKMLAYRLKQIIVPCLSWPNLD